MTIGIQVAQAGAKVLTLQWQELGAIPRQQIVEIRIKRIAGPGRLIGAAGAGSAAALGLLPWAISDSRVNVSDGTRVAQWGAITAAAVAGGYWIGRLIDTKETEIRIAPVVTVPRQ